MRDNDDLPGSQPSVHENKAGYFYQRQRETLPHQIYPADWLRQAEPQAAESLQCSLYDLMRFAGKEGFLLAKQQYPASKHWLILCGHGNNGGDGYVVATLAKAANIQVTLVAVNQQKPLPEPAASAQKCWLESGGTLHQPDEPLPEDIDLIIDALLGTGLTSAPRAQEARLIGLANDYIMPTGAQAIAPASAQSSTLASPSATTSATTPASPSATTGSSVPIVALDLPSGLLADSGSTPGVAMRAQHTVTFIALKAGLFTGQGRRYSGQVHYRSLGLDQWLAQQAVATLHRYHLRDLSHWFTPRNPCAHKGDHGRLLVVGGAQGMGGAVRMAAEAALRAGAGLVRVLTDAANISAILAARPELMVSELTQQQLADGLQWADALVIGPGLGQQDWGKQALEQAVQFSKPMLWDADALNLLAQNPDLCPSVCPRRIITPHPAEAARLLSCSVAEIESDRLLASQRLLARYGGCVLLKGAGSLVADEKQRGIIDTGNPGMATAGMGDILSGIIGGLLAQGMPPYDALCAGSVAHGAAADWLAARYGCRGMLAMDLLKVLHYFIN